MNHIDLFNETYEKWAEKKPRTPKAIEQRIKMLETLEWMRKNEYHFTKVTTGKGVRWNLFDCRDSNSIRFIATFRALSSLVKHVQANGCFG